MWLPKLTEKGLASGGPKESYQGTYFFPPILYQSLLSPQKKVKRPSREVLLRHSLWGISWQAQPKKKIPTLESRVKIADLIPTRYAQTHLSYKPVPKELLVPIGKALPSAQSSDESWQQLLAVADWYKEESYTVLKHRRAEKKEREVMSGVMLHAGIKLKPQLTH